MREPFELYDEYDGRQQVFAQWNSNNEFCMTCDNNEWPEVDNPEYVWCPIVAHYVYRGDKPVDHSCYRWNQ